MGLLAKDPQSTEAPPSAVALSNALRSCEEGAGLPDGVKIFAEALPGVHFRMSSGKGKDPGAVRFLQPLPISTSK